MTKDCGVYCITNTVNGNKYIGSALRIQRRWCQHKKMLSKNVHHSGYLQNAWNKYGAENFEFSVLEYCEIDYLIRCEQFYIDSEYPEYNMCPTAGSCLGKRHTEEAKRQISEAHKGTHPSEETRAKISKALKGKPHTEEHNRKNSEARMGELNPMFGKRHTDETCAKMRAGRKALFKAQKELQTGGAL